MIDIFGKHHSIFPTVNSAAINRCTLSYGFLCMTEMLSSVCKGISTVHVICPVLPAVVVPLFPAFVFCRFLMMAILTEGSGSPHWIFDLHFSDNQCAASTWWWFWPPVYLQQKECIYMQTITHYLRHASRPSDYIPMASLKLCEWGNWQGTVMGFMRNNEQNKLYYVQLTYTKHSCIWTHM